MNTAANADTDLEGLTMRERVSHFRMMVNQSAPYLTPYVYSLVMVERPGIGTMAVDKHGRMYFDPKFVESLTLEQGGYVVLHETWHLILRHCHRAKDIIGDNPTRRQRDRLNVAYDCVIWELMESIAHHAPTIDGKSCITYPLLKERYPALERNLLPQEIYNLMEEQDDRPTPEPEQEEDEGEEPKIGGDFPQPVDEEEEFDPDVEPQDSGDDYNSDEESDDDQVSKRDETEEADDQQAEDESDGDGEDQDEVDGEDGAEEDGDDGDPIGGDAKREPAHSDLSRIGNGSCADGLPRDYEEEANDNWDTFIEDQLLEQVEKRIEEQEEREWQHGRGNIPGCLKETIKNKLRPQPNPWDKLRAAVNLAAANPRGQKDFTYSRPSRRQHSLPAGFPLLKGHRNYAPKAAVIVDTSGSMTTQCKVKALNVIAQGLRAVGDFPVICGDTRVQSDVRLSALSDQFDMAGGGGTDMVKLIEYAVEKYHPDVLVLATDGGTSWPDKPIKGQLIIALTQQLDTPAWATTVYIPDDGKK